MNTLSQFVETVFEDYPNLEVIDFNNRCVLAISPKSGKAHFIYEVNEDLSFHFHMLCEVGAPYQSWFESAINKAGYKLESKETDTDYFEVLVKI